MKYEAEVDLRNANTSHALLVDLVGRDQRVLDIGCAGGDLGQMLKRRGCRVSGVELDDAAAQVAEQVLDDVLVGDVTELDLVDHFGKESFDAVVFGDVLEHLADPVSVLRRVRPLLRQSGAVVASLPNVSHGSVRLSLLKGHFDYRPLGLLDATHLRFFTRGSVHEMLREAGLVAIDMRRTTAGVFDTEISLRRSDFDEGVVDAVEGDPESTTYQFVLRAVPEDSPDALGTQTPGEGTSRPAARCRIGVWVNHGPDDIFPALAARVTCAELARRLPGATIRSFSSAGDSRPSPHDGGAPIEPLGPWSFERASQLAKELDCVVIAGNLPQPTEAELNGGQHPNRFLVEGLGQENEVECPVVWSAVRLPQESLTGPDRTVAYRSILDMSPSSPPARALDDDGVGVPDPLLLVPRLLQREALVRRIEFVRIMGWFPQRGRAVVVEIAGGLLPYAEDVARALDAAVSGTDASVVLLQTQPGDADGDHALDAVSASMAAPVYRVPGDALVDDRVAVIANAAAIAVCSPSTAAVGLSYERPVAYMKFAGDASLNHLAGLTGTLDAVVSRPDELANLLGGEHFNPPAGVVTKLQSKLDAHFDRMAGIADTSAAARPRTPATGAVLPPAEYMAAMELAYRRMQERLDSERRAVADHLRDLRTMHGAEVVRAQAEIDRLRSHTASLHEALEADLRDQRDRAVADLEALQGIRVLRLLRPFRAVYARVRGGRL